jgi:hypothetical protein
MKKTTKKNIAEVKVVKVIETKPVPARWFKQVNPLNGYTFTK